MNSTRKRALAALTVAAIIFSLMMPATVEARGILRGIGKAIDFIVSVPQKLTRPLGPLAPLADIWLAGAMPTKFAKVFIKAREIKAAKNDIATQKAKLKEVKQVYRTQAEALRARAQSLAAGKPALEAQMLGGNIKFKDYAAKVAALGRMSETLNKAADKLDRRAKSLTAADVIKLFGTRVAKTLLNDSLTAVRQEAGKELKGLLRAKKAVAFIKGKGLSANDVIAEVLAGDAARALGDERDGAGSLKSRLRKRFKERLAETKGRLKDDWRTEISIVYEELKKWGDDLIKDIGPLGEDEVIPPAARTPSGADPGPAQDDGAGGDRPVYPAVGDVGARGAANLKLGFKVNEYYADKAKLISYDGNLKIDAGGRITGDYTVQYDEPGLYASDTVTYVETGTLSEANVGSAGGSFRTAVAVHIKKSRGGRVVSETDETINNGFGGTLEADRGGTGTLQLSAGYGLQWWIMR